MIVNFLLFQIGWFACVLGAANGRAWIGVVTVVVIWIVHLMTKGTRTDVPLILVAGVFGFVADTVLARTGAVGYSAELPIERFAPAWIVAMWINLAITLRHSLVWLSRRPRLAAALGAVFGPAAYWGAARLGAVRMVEPSLATVGVAAVWGLALPVLFWVSRCLERIADRSDQAIGG